MQIWIDGDACPRVIKTILFRAATRTQTQLIIVSNHPLCIPSSPWIKRWQVGLGFDTVDNYIVEHLMPHDLVITADIPFADAAITQGAQVLNPRGELYSTHNIKQHLANRNRNELLRACQQLNGGPDSLSTKEIHTFSRHLDHMLIKNSHKIPKERT